LDDFGKASIANPSVKTNLKYLTMDEACSTRRSGRFGSRNMNTSRQSFSKIKCNRLDPVVKFAVHGNSLDVLDQIGILVRNLVAITMSWRMKIETLLTLL
jgi:hypothetical protein